MRSLDWLVLAGTIAGIVFYGMWLGRRKRDMESYLLASHSMPWWLVLVSVMATQASATTFISIPGLGYAEGMRFVQFYFGLPLAMTVLSITAIPIYHKLHVYTAYEYLEGRFDKKTRTLTALIFLLMRGLSTGITIYTPALVLSVMLHWNISLTILLMGGLALLYTSWGGSASVGRTQFVQFIIIVVGMVLAFRATLDRLPDGTGVADAWALASCTRRTEWLDFTFDWKNKYTFWSGLIGGCFVQMSYFGADQSQVGRYLAGRNINESRLGLLFNGLLKIPMQFAILLTGLMVFAVYQFLPAPLNFNTVELQELRSGPRAAEIIMLEREHAQAAAARRERAEHFLQLRHAGAATPEVEAAGRALADAEAGVARVRERARAIVREQNPSADKNDNDYVFLRFVLDQLPAGLVGLVLAGIFCASMSACSAQLNALSAASVVDIYKNIFVKNASDAACVRASRIATVAWGVLGMLFAQFAGRLGSLVEAVNELGSLFYGTMLGIFLVAFYLKRIGGTAVFVAALISEAAVIGIYFSGAVSYLWYTIAGCILVILISAALALFRIDPARKVIS